MLPVLVLALWIAIHKVRWLGPMLADGARAILGPRAVAWIEDVAYDLDDRFRRARHKEDAPEPYWEVPTETAPPPVPADAGDDAAPRAPAWRPADVPPVIEKFAAPGDGVWVPIRDPRHPTDDAVMYKTLLHPDRGRPWTAVSIVAIDLAQTDVHSVAGKAEPESTEPGAKAYARTGIIPDDALPTLLAAWNGGYKSVHGHWGMKVDGVMLARPHGDGCTFARYDDGSFVIAPWRQLEAEEPKLVFARQTPLCLVLGGKLHQGLTLEDNTAWGAAIGGSTVIRRSAVGLTEDKKTLFVAIGDAANAPVIATSLKHVGAVAVAQLDVNWSFPRFLIYAPRDGTGELVATPLCKGFEFSENEYVREHASRDFFYLTRKAP